jgi:transposase/Trp operon repressor
MLQIRKILQLLSNGSTQREINRETGIHRLTIRQYAERFESTGKDFAELLSYSDEELSGLILSPKPEIIHDARRQWLEERVQDYLSELQRPYMTRQLLWEEYRQKQPQGYSYSQFCDILQRYKKRTETSLHITHFPGERYEFDFAGDPLYYFDPVSNVRVICPVLACTLPSSGLGYVEPLASARLVHLIPALNRAVQYLGGVPRFMVTDNMTQIVTQSSRYEPTFTELADQWSVHYNTAIKATRVRRPKDKPSVEKSVHLSYQRIYARMRNETYYSLHELKNRVLELLEEFNDRPMQEYGISRRERFLQQEKATLRPLPETSFSLKNRTRAKVKKNYHVILGEDMHSYSVPHQYVSQETSIVYDEDVVEIFLGNLQRIAIHPRDTRRYGYSTLPEHRSESHRCYLEQRGWCQDDFIEMAARIGENTGKSIDRLLTSRVFIEQTYDSCIGVLHLGKKYGNDRLESACKRANLGSRVNYKIIKNILENNLDKVQIQENLFSFFIPDHNNLRGPEAYY